MARYTKPPELEVAERAMKTLGPKLSAREGPMQGVNDLKFETGTDYYGDLAITFLIELQSDRPEPDIEQTETLERMIRDTVWAHEVDERIHVYFRYRVEGELPVEDTGDDLSSEARA